jgi:hypothetical protein
MQGPCAVFVCLASPPKFIREPLDPPSLNATPTATIHQNLSFFHRPHHTLRQRMNLTLQFIMYVLGLKTSVLPTSIWHSQMCQCMYIHIFISRLTSVSSSIQAVLDPGTAVYGLVLLEPSGLAVQNAEWQVGTLLSLSPW